MGFATSIDILNLQNGNNINLNVSGLYLVMSTCVQVDDVAYSNENWNPPPPKPKINFSEDCGASWDSKLILAKGSNDNSSDADDERNVKIRELFASELQRRIN